jgi:hypothetical protein
MHKTISSWVSTFIYPETEPDEWLPLYTHPAEHDLGIAEAIGFDKGYKAATAKTLTDEEIEKVFYELDVGHSATDFAKAILRKAQEK